MQCSVRYCQIPPPSNAALALTLALPRPEQEPFEYARGSAGNQVAEHRISGDSAIPSVAPR